LNVVPRPIPAAPRRYLIVVPRPIDAAAPHKYLIVVPMLFPAVPLVMRRRTSSFRPAAARGAFPFGLRRRCLIVVPRPLPAAALVVRRRYRIALPWPFPAAPLVCVVGA
jgi:hypothetical protein